MNLDIKTNSMNLSESVENGSFRTSKLFDIQIWTIDDVANYLSVSKGHIYNLVSRNEIPFRKRGKRGKLYFIPQEIFDWIYEEKT